MAPCGSHCGAVANLMKALLCVMALALMVACAPVNPAYRQPTAKTALGAMVPDAEDLKPASVTLHMDVDFTHQEREDLATAVGVWSRQTSGLAAIWLIYDLDFGDMLGLQEHVFQDHNTVVRLTEGLMSVASADLEAHCGACVLGWMTNGGIHNEHHTPVHGAFVVDRLTTQNRRVQVFIHEFGHVLGLAHVAQRHAIMYPSIVEGRSTCLKKPDLVEFCAVNNCPPSALLLPCE